MLIVLSSTGLYIISSGNHAFVIEKLLTETDKKKIYENLENK
jgi:hypothetical protein